MTQLYFDYAATTPIDDRVIQAMLGCMGHETRFGNPASSSHAYGQAARQAVEEARQQVATLVGSPATAIIWTSGATESNNLALKGIAASAGARRHIVSSRLEHKAVLDTLAQLVREGFEVTWLEPDGNGLIQPDAVAAALRDDTLLVSLMLVNNELGTLTDIAAVGERVRQQGALLNVDAAQAVGKVAIDLSRLAVDLMSFSAHKIYGPKGVGALYVGERARPLLQAQIHGGGHEQGLRSGTLATHQIVGMGAACALAGELLAQEGERIARLSAGLCEGVLALPQVRLNGCPLQRVPHTLSLRIDDPWFNSASLSGRLAFSSTSACNSGSAEPSHVLCAIGLDATQAARTVRLSIGRYSTAEEIGQVIAVFAAALGTRP